MRFSINKMCSDCKTKPESKAVFTICLGFDKRLNYFELPLLILPYLNMMMVIVAALENCYKV